MATLTKRKHPPSPYWQISYTVSGLTKRTSTGIRHHGKKYPCSLARAVLRELEDKLARTKFGLNPIPDHKLLVDFFAELEKSRKATYAKTTLTRQKVIAKHFLDWADTARILFVADVTGPRAIQYIDAHRRDALPAGLTGEDRPSLARNGMLSPNSLANYRAFLQSAWDEARKRNYCHFIENPWRIKIKAQKVEKTAFSAEQITAMLALTEPDWMPELVRLGLCTGARLDSVKHLERQHISYEFNVINFVVSKTGPYSMPLHPELKAYMQDRGKRGLCDPGRAAKDKSINFLSGSFTEQVYRQCGFHANFHMFRHTFTTMLARAGVEKRIAQLMTNHTDSEIHDHYTHIEAGELVPHLAKVSMGL